MNKIDYGKFYTYDELSSALTYFADKYPKLMKLSVLDVTEEGRNIYLVEISDDVCSEDTDKKAGYYMQASLHSSEPAGGTVALHFIETLLTTKPDILKTHVFYIVPRVNPDGIEANLVYNACTRSRNAEDPRRRENVIRVKDMDGDGLILNMRIKNPLGDYKEVAPGVMVQRKPGETEGEFYDLYVEGEVINPNGSAMDYTHRSYDFNRSFPANWAPLSNSTEYPLKHTETRAVAEFLVNHPNIFAGLDYHNGQNGILRSPMCDDSKILREDLELIVNIGNIASETIGFPLIQEYKYGKYPHVLNGNTNDFAYNVLGISHYVVELGNGFNDAGLETLEYLTYENRDFFYPNIKEYSEKEGYEVFYDFKPFKHPQLGDVEIGGLRGGRGYYQNPKVLEKITPKTTEFMLKHAAMGPDIRIDGCKCVNVGGNIYRIRAQVKNLGIMGTKVMKGVNSYQASYPVHIYLEGDDIKVYSRPNVYEIPKLDSMESTYVEWFVEKQNDTPVTIIAEHPKSPVAKATVK